jgi:Flp pilus assembly protein TadD
VFRNDDPSREHGNVAQRVAMLLIGLLAGCGSTGSGAGQGEIVISTGMEGPVELRPLRQTLLAWERLAPMEARPPALAAAAEAVSAGDLDGAFEALNQGVREAPESAVLVAARGHLERTLGYLRTAEGDFQRATELDPEDAHAWSELGRTRLSLGLHGGAAHAFERAVALGLDDPEHHMLLAQAYRGAGRCEDATREYLAVLEYLHVRPAEGFLFGMLSLAGSAVSPIGLLATPLGETGFVGESCLDEAISRDDLAALRAER